jgi:hypothetical protein
MGRLHYGQDEYSADFDDPTLAHLQMIIAAKLRRQESFMMTWERESIGRTSLWMHAAIPLRFEFDQTEPVPLNRAWIEVLNSSANGVAGLRIVPEPPAMRATA